jgi:hypothetical protein
MSLRWSLTAVLALSALGCSDPVPPPAQAGLLLQMRNGSQAAGKACNVTALTKTVPDRDPQLVEGPTISNPGVRILDGEDKSKISCAVKGSGTFSVSGSIQYGSTSFTILGGSVTAGASGTGQVSVYTAETGSLSSASGTPCTFDVTGGSLQIKPGSMWAEFNCPTLETTPAVACAASGVVILENCTE